jgi:hypothetical protein
VKAINLGIELVTSRIRFLKEVVDRVPVTPYDFEEQGEEEET